MPYKDPVVRRQKHLIYERVYRKKQSKKLLSQRGRASNCRQRYGITFGIYQILYKAQSGLCAICHKPEKVLSIDHDHRNSGCIRGLLCNACNVALGGFRDNPKTLQNAIRYLENAS